MYFCENVFYFVDNLIVFPGLFRCLNIINKWSCQRLHCMLPVKLNQKVHDVVHLPFKVKYDSYLRVLCDNVK